MVTITPFFDGMIDSSSATAALKMVSHWEWDGAESVGGEYLHRTATKSSLGLACRILNRQASQGLCGEKNADQSELFSSSKSSFVDRWSRVNGTSSIPASPRFPTAGRLNAYPPASSR